MEPKMIKKCHIVGICVVVFVILALEIPSLCYGGTRPFPRRSLDFMYPAKSWFVRTCSNTARDSSKADSYRASSSQLQAEQEAQRRREQERAKLERQRLREIQILKSMQEQDKIDAENREYERQEQQLLLQSLTPAKPPAPSHKIGPNR